MNKNTKNIKMQMKNRNQMISLQHDDEDKAKPSSHAHVVAKANETYSVNEVVEDGICVVMNDKDDKFKQRHD